jgi:hypothetical protein
MLYFGNGKSGTITQGNTHTLQENYSKWKTVEWKFHLVKLEKGRR